MLGNREGDVVRGEVSSGDGEEVGVAGGGRNKGGEGVLGGGRLGD